MKDINIKNKSRKEDQFNSEQYLSISELSSKYDLDRGAVKSRLNQAGIEPNIRRVNAVLYVLTDEIHDVLSAEDQEMKELQRRKLKAEADLKEIQRDEKKGEMLSTDEVKNVVIAIFSRLHNEIIQQIPKKIAGKLLKAKTNAEMTAIIKAELELTFNDIRQDYPKFLEN